MAEESKIEVGKDYEEIVHLPAKVEDFLAIAERRITGFDKVVKVAIQATNEKNWTIWTDKPRPTSGGALKMARPFGVKIHFQDPKKVWTEDEEKRFYFYQVEGTAELPGGFDSVFALGTCSEKDTFFSKAKGRVLKRSEIDETDIVKKAVSNFYVNAIMALFGMKDITLEELKENGLDTDKIQRVSFTEGKKGESTVEEGSKRDQIRNMLLEMNDNDEGKAKDQLVELTTFTGRDNKTVRGKQSVSLLSDKQTHVVHANVEKIYNEWKKGAGEEVDGKEVALNILTESKITGVIPKNLTKDEINIIIDLRKDKEALQKALNEMNEGRKK